MPGVIIEAGVAAGGSAIVLASAKDPSRNLLLYDVFGLIPAPSSKDGDDVHRRYRTIVEGRAKGIRDERYYGYDEDLFEHVRERLSSFGYAPDANNIHLVQGVFEETLELSDPVLLAHIDCDWYESVRTCLIRVEPHLVVGGTIVIDDYDAWSGCREAVDEFFVDKRDRYRLEHRGRLHVTKERD